MKCCGVVRALGWAATQCSLPQKNDNETKTMCVSHSSEAAAFGSSC